MVAIVHRHEPTYLYRAWRFLLVTRENGDIVRLSWKQLASLMASCIAPALVVAGSVWYWAERVVILERSDSYQETRIVKAEIEIDSIKNREAELLRIDQHLRDIDRQLAEIRDFYRDAKRNP
jgi:hypothetical protein